MSIAMTTMTRRTAITTLTGSLLAVAIIRANPGFGKAATSDPDLIANEAWASSIDDQAVGAGADLNLLRGQISAFFGNSKGHYLADQVVDLETAAPGWDTRSRSVYDQFVSIFRGAPEYDAKLSNGVRMVVRFMSTYKAAVFLDSSGLLVGAALTFDFCPPDGVDQIINGHSVHTACLWPFSAVLFFNGENPDPMISAALKNYVTGLPMPTERAMASTMTSDGKIRVRIVARQI